METILFIAVVAATFVVLMLLYFKLTGSKKKVEEVLAAIVENFLDEKQFTTAKLAEIVNKSEDELKPILEELKAARVLSGGAHGRYYLVDPLVFLSPKDIERARRITKDDNILYGAYQSPYLANYMLLLIYLVFVAILVFVGLAYFDIFGLGTWLSSVLPPGALYPFLLFLVGMGIIIVDVLDNIVKAYQRERYSVVVGWYSGISYDVSFADELSGRIPRGAIRDVDINISLLQKILNYFADVPHGDVVVKVRNKKEPIVFRNMPYPRELLYVIRSIQLGSLQWRKRHARTLMMWRARLAVPPVVRL